MLVLVGLLFGIAWQAIGVLRRQRSGWLIGSLLGLVCIIGTAIQADMNDDPEGKLFGWFLAIVSGLIWSCLGLTGLWLFRRKQV